MRRIIVKNAHRIFNFTKEVILAGVSNIDSAVQMGQTLHADDIDVRTDVEKVNHFEQHVSFVGEIVEVQNTKTGKISGQIIIKQIYKIHTDDLSAEEVRLIGFDDLEALQREERLGSRYMWLMKVQPVSSEMAD